MLRSEFVARMHRAMAARQAPVSVRGEQRRIDARLVESMVDTVLDQISAALERGDRVELRGFGAFSVRAREARTGRNPRTGAAVAVAPKKVPFFKPGKELRLRLNGDAEE